MSIKVFLGDGTMIERGSAVMIKEGEAGNDTFKAMIPYLVKSITRSGLGHYNIGLETQAHIDTGYAFKCFPCSNLINGIM